MSSSQSDADNLIPFSDAVKLEKLGPHAYRANLRDTFLIGTGKATSRLRPNAGQPMSALTNSAHTSTKRRICQLMPLASCKSLAGIKRATAPLDSSL